MFEQKRLKRYLLRRGWLCWSCSFWVDKAPDFFSECLGLDGLDPDVPMLWAGQKDFLDLNLLCHGGGVAVAWRLVGVEEVSSGVSAGEDQRDWSGVLVLSEIRAHNC